jgi:heme/copper-type cytochrome/quinol oxidase subunit 2
VRRRGARVRRAVRTRAFPIATVAAAALLAAALLATRLAGQSTAGQDDRRREVAVRVSGAGFEPARIDARVNEIVVVTLTAAEEPHGFAVDAYRLSKRVSPETPLRFEFRADATGTFRFYCSLTGRDGRPHDEHGELAVRR